MIFFSAEFHLLCQKWLIQIYFSRFKNSNFKVKKSLFYEAWIKWEWHYHSMRHHWKKQENPCCPRNKRILVVHRTISGLTARGRAGCLLVLFTRNFCRPTNWQLMRICVNTYWCESCDCLPSPMTPSMPEELRSSPKADRAGTRLLSDLDNVQLGVPKSIRRRVNSNTRHHHKNTLGSFSSLRGK